MTFCKILGVCLAFGVVGGQAVAQDAGANRVSFYVGGGEAIKDDPLKNGDTPFAIGLMTQAPNSRLVLGFDFGFEGTMIDSTWGQDQNLSQGTSINLLVGGNLVDSDRFKTDAALLVGMREAVADCPHSYLGFQCYADTDPDYEYEINFGAVVTVSFGNALLGVRATGESTQLLAGVRF